MMQDSFPQATLGIFLHWASTCRKANSMARSIYIPVRGTRLKAISFVMHGHGVSN